MKKIFMFMSLAGLLTACNNSTEQPAAEVKEELKEAAVVEKPAVSFPYTATYSSDFSIGDPAMTKKVLEMYKAMEAGQFDSLGQYFSDTVHWRNFAEDDVMLTREGLVSKVKGFRSRFKEISETPISFTALHSNDRNDDWVLTWIKEKVVYPNGKKDSTTYQETWRIKNGKIYMHDSYAKYRK